MATQLSYINPSTGQRITLSVNLTPTVAMRYNGKVGFGDLDEAFLTLTGSRTTAAGVTETVNVSQSALEAYYMCVNGGEYIPHPLEEGRECYITADLAAAGTSMAVSAHQTKWKGVTENIFVANRPYLLMHRKPVPGENIFETGTEDGLIKPAAEIIFVGGAYSSGSPVTIVRGTGAVDRKKMAVVQAITGHRASRDNFSEHAGLLYELERPDTVVLGTQESPSSTTVKAVFTKSVQQADTPNSGNYGVVSHYGVWVLPKSGKFLHNVRGLPENAPPSQYDDTGQVDAVVAIDSAKIVVESSYLTITGLNRAWNPLTGALDAISAGWYWVGVKAMNQAEFNADLRASRISFAAVEVT